MKLISLALCAAAAAMTWMFPAAAIEKGVTAAAKDPKSLAVRVPYLHHFNPADKGRSLVNAYLCAGLSRAAYTRKDFKEYAERGGATRHDFRREKTTDTEWGIVDMPHVVLLVFRGSEGKLAINDLTDWYYDSSVQLLSAKHWGGGKVHRGFAKAADSVFAEVASTTALYAGARTPVFICGHSLGGALATLVAFRLTEKMANVRGLYTYGTPRVGDKDFRKAFETKGLVYGRWVNGRDPAPLLPPQRLHLYQIGKMHRLKSDSGVTLDSSADYPFDLTQVSDHYMDNYLKKLWAVIPAEQKALLPRP